MADHDHSYKNLFAHARMVQDLLTGFVKQDWVEQLDFSTLEKLNGSYISDDLRERADDVVWRVKFKDQWLYVYLLLEFQSTVDPFMAVRILTYVGLLYQDLIKSGQLPDKQHLPPVLPIVLYNGSKPWRAKLSVSELVQTLPDALKNYQPEQRYFLVDEGRYTETELASLENLVAGLIRAEIAESPQQIARVLANLVLWLPQPEQSDLRRAFKEWFNRILLPERMPNTEFESLRDLTEIEAMLAERVKDWTHHWKEEGKIEGKIEGEALVLSKLLVKRFGPLPTWAEDKLNNASAPQLEAWAERIFDADSLEQFFE